MPSVVIIHAAEDALPARALAEKLRAARLTPVIEQAPGDALRQAVRDAAVTLALWSPRSVGQAALVDEVSFAKSKGKVVHARMQNAANPDPFGNEGSIDLTGWRGEDDFPGWRELANTVTSMAGVPAPPPPAPAGPAGFFQPGMPTNGGPNPQRAAPQQQQRAPQQQQQQRAAPPPQQQQQRQQPSAQQQRAAPQAAPRPQPAPRSSAPDEPRKGGGGMMIGIIALVVIGLGVGGYFVWNNMQGSQAAGSAWEEVAQNDASALRAFIAGEPGSYRDEAEAALATLEEQTFDAAREEDSIQGFENFLGEFPDSDHAIEARGRIAELQSLPPEGEVPLDPALTTDPNAPPVDPDLVPPGAATADPNAPGGPATLAPPATETPAPAPAEEEAPGAPLN